MLANALRTVYQYNQWATERLLDTADRLTPEQLHTPGNAGHGSVRDTLVHLISAQRRWLLWWNGSLPALEAYNFRIDPADLPDIVAVRAAWEALEEDAQAFVGGLTDTDVERIYEFTLPDGTEVRFPLWQMMLHVANHGTQHRSEVAAMLTGFGHSPGILDLISYLWSVATGRAD
jgi:uncharacterized damage-inducible protein DinB